MRHAAPSTLPGLASRTLSPTCPTLCMWLRCFASGHARGPFQPGVGLPRRSRGSPGDLETVEWGNAVHFHEPSGISVRILVEGSQSPMALRDGRGVQSAPADESTCGRAARANYGKTHVTWCCRGAPRRDAIKLVQIGQNQAAATHRNRYFYDLRSSPQLHVQFPGTSAAIKARNPRHPQKQLQHH